GTALPVLMPTWLHIAGNHTIDPALAPRVKVDRSVSSAGITLPPLGVAAGIDIVISVNGAGSNAVRAIATVNGIANPLLPNGMWTFSADALEYNSDCTSLAPDDTEK